MQANDPSIAGDANPVSDNLSFEELVFTNREEIPLEPEAEEESIDNLDGAEAEESEVESDEAEEAEEEEESGESESEIDLLSLTTEQIQELAKKGKSRLLQRVGELTAQKKALEEKLLSQPQVKEIEQHVLPDFIRALDTADKLKAKYTELEGTLETTDQLLEEHEDYGPDDFIVVGDKEFTKKQIRQANRNAREAINKLIPAQAQHLAKLEQYQQLEAQYSEAAKKEVPAILDENSEVGKQFKNLIEDPLVGKLKRSVPELGFQIEYILAHAARSIFSKGSAKLPSGAGEKLKANPPASPVSSSMQKSKNSAKSKQQDAYKRFEASGSIEDLIAARISRHS
jgi:hypothetical protein